MTTRRKILGSLASGSYPESTIEIRRGERGRVSMTASEPGLFMYHCHNLEHEDGGMMRNFLVEA